MNTPRPDLTQPDLVRRVAAGRPTDEHLTQAWPQAEQDALLARVLDTPAADAEHTRRPARPGRRAAWLVAAAAVTGLALVPTLGDGGEASARTTILRLAAVAADSDEPVIAPGSYLHVRTSSVQENLPGSPEPETTYYVDRDSWIAWDGTKWYVETYPKRRYRDYYALPAPDGTLRAPTPEFIASLPDDPQAFRALLDPNVSGSSSHEEALIEAVSHLVNSRLLTPDKLSVALESIADIEQLDVKYVQVDGREAVKISFWEDEQTENAFTIDSSTAQLVETSFTASIVEYVSTTTLSETVAEVPASVLAAIERFPDGQTVCFDGTVLANRDDATC